MDEDKIENNIEGIKEDNKSSEKIIENKTTNDEMSTSSLLQPAGNEKLASEYEQFMKMVCTTTTITDVTKEYSPKKNPVKSTSPHSYHEFDIESNLAEDSIEIPLKEKFEKRDNKQQTLEGSIKSIECEESTLSTDCQIQVNDSNVQIERSNENESEDSKSIPSDWENVRIKVERLSDENTESREIKKKKKQKKITSSSSSSSTTSSDSEKEKKKRKRKRKVLSNSSSSDSDSTDSSSSSSDSSSSEERRKRKRKKKKVEKKRKKVKRTVRIKKKRRRKMSTDSNSDSDKHIKKRKKVKKKAIEAKSINNGDISKMITKSPVISSSSDGTKILQSVTPGRKIKEEAANKDRNKSDQVTLTKKAIADMSVHDNQLKQKKERNENKPDENFMEQWEMDSMMPQNDDDVSSQDRTGELEKIDDLEKGKYRRKRKHSRDNIEYDKDRSFKVNDERIREGKARSDEETETKRKKKREKDIKSSTEFLANWERESERITQQIQNEAKYLKKLGRQKKEKWGETDFDTLNVPSLTQLEKEGCQKQLLADEWEVDSLEAISDLIMSKRKSGHGSLKKIEKEVRYDKKTDTYIAIEKESVREMKKKQERLCAIRIWEEEQEEGEREELMLLEQKSKQHKTDDWDIEEESVFRKNTEEMEVCKVNDIVAIEKDWTKMDEEKIIKEDANKLTMKSNKRVKKSRWDMGSQSEEKPESKDIWEEDYTEWSKINKCEQEFEKTKKDELHTADYSESKSNLIDFYHRKPQSKESLERSWTSEEVVIRSMQVKKDASVKHLISAKTNEEQLASIKEQTRDQFKEILESDVKFKEKTLELYSPSSPALSQKSQVKYFYLTRKLSYE